MNAHALAVSAPPPVATAKPQQAPLAPAAPVVIRLDQVTRTFRPKGGAPVTALDAVSLAVREGEVVGVIGRSGAGKSTLVRIVNGLESPSAGRVEVGGVAIATLPAHAARVARRSIGMVFQHFNLLASRTAAGNIALPLEIAGAPPGEIAARVDELLGLVGLTAQRERYPAELSGGQKQRVGIARALATRPKVLLCDEATSALDPETTQQILQLLGRIRNELRLSIVLITHEMAVVKAIADSVAVIESGRIVEQGRTADVFARPRHAATRSLLRSADDLPASLRARLRSEPQNGGRAVIRVVFAGEQAGEPVLSRLARVVDIDINILAGQLEEIGGAPFGTLLIAVPSADVTLRAVVAALARLELAAEVVGYVA